jgi:glucosyl-3-phosphoglycerate synthase
LSSLSRTRRTYHHSRFTPELLAAERDCTVSVCLPARDEAATIGPIVESLMLLREQGVVDQVAVVDASTDGTGEIAAALGAEVHPQAELMPGFGAVRGKGDALWRALSVLRGDVVCFVDADSEQFGPHFACGLIGPLITDPDVRFVKGFYRRPFKLGAESTAEGGGRVTELTARPLLELFYPELAGIRQPLAGEVAARRDLLERLPFATGYAVEVAMLIDAWSVTGADAIAQVDLDVRQNRHQPLSALGPMAAAVLRAVAERLEREGRLSAGVALGGQSDPIVERPPMASLRAAA